MVKGIIKKMLKVRLFSLNNKKLMQLKININLINKKHTNNKNINYIQNIF